MAPHRQRKAVPLSSAAPSASFTNFHQRSGSPKRIRRRSSVTNRVGISRDHMYSRSLGPPGKIHGVPCLRPAPEACRCRFASCVSRQCLAESDRKMSGQQNACVGLGCFRGFQLFLRSQEESATARARPLKRTNNLACCQIAQIAGPQSKPRTGPRASPQILRLSPPATIPKQCPHGTGEI